jgi:hypothetical protein
MGAGPIPRRRSARSKRNWLAAAARRNVVAMANDEQQYLFECARDLEAFVEAKQKSNAIDGKVNDPFNQAMIKLIADRSQEVYDILKKRIVDLETRLAEIETRGIKFRGTYVRSVEYVRGDMVVHDGSCFACIEGVQPNEAPGTSAKWALAARAGRDARDRDKK